MKKMVMITMALLSSVAISAYATTSPHFYLTVTNNMGNNISMQLNSVNGRESFSKNTTCPGDSSVNSVINSKTTSAQYGICFYGGPKPTDTFKVKLTNTLDCTITVGFHAPGEPTINTSGKGCYQVFPKTQGMTLNLDVSKLYV